MHRLAEFEHHVLGDVDQQADRTDAAAAQTFGHPHRRLARGVDASITRPTNRGHPPPPSSAHREASRRSGRHRRGAGGASAARAAGATSNAMPRTLKQSARLGVSFIRCSCREAEVSASGVPTGARRAVRAGRRHRRRGRVPSPSTASVRFDAAQLRRLDGHVAASFAPIVASGAFRPGARVRRAADDLQHAAPSASTWQTCSRSASGCFVRIHDAPTTTPSSASPRPRCPRLPGRLVESRRERRRASPRVSTLAQPVCRASCVSPQANWRRKRTSLSKKLRRSSTP